MKLFFVVALAALTQNFAAADLVSVEGDGTYNIKGPVCSGPGSSSAPAGSACPQIGDTAVEQCFQYHPSYDAKTGKCVAPVPAVCKPVKGGVWGCVWDLSGVKPPTQPTTPPVSGCTDVSVEGDGTFCVKGPICSGSGSKPAGSACPQIGDAAVRDCHPYNPSFDAKSGKCVAPVPAVCKPAKTGVWGCVWDLTGVKPVPVPSATPAPTPSATPAPVPSSTQTPAPAPGLVDVRVVGDGVFKVKAPVCGGPAANKTGDACPVVGDVAVSGCAPTNPSYDAKSGKCVAPVPALCQPTQNGTVWGCVWDLSGASTAKVSAAASSPVSSSSSGGSSTGVFVGSFVGVAGVVAAIAAAVASKKRKSQPQIDTETFVAEVSPQPAPATSQSSRHV